MTLEIAIRVEVNPKGEVISDIAKMRGKFSKAEAAIAHLNMAKIQHRLITVIKDNIGTARIEK